MTDSTAVKKDTQRLQRAIVEGLEDVKAQDIRVFNTEHLSPLFERVIIASGTSNRQTKALAASVRDAVREAGFGKPRIEGEVNGEWIIVDCGAAVAHIMQPAIRTYYQLEQIWGDKPVRLKLGAPKPAMPAQAASAGKTAGKTASKASSKSASAAAGKKPAGKTSAQGPATKAAPVSLRRSSAALKGQREADAAAKAEAEAAKPKARRSTRSTAKPAPGAVSGKASRTSASATAKRPVKAAPKAAAPAPSKAPAKSSPTSSPKPSPKTAPAKKSAGAAAKTPRRPA